MDKIKTVIIDDDEIVVMSLKMIAESSGIEVVATGHSGEDAVRLYELHKPDILLSDIRMNGMDGTVAAAQILKKNPDARILFLTTFSDDEYITKALKYGVKGYILKQDFEGIVPAIKAVYKGQSVFVFLLLPLCLDMCSTAQWWRECSEWSQTGPHRVLPSRMEWIISPCPLGKCSSSSFSTLPALAPSSVPSWAFCLVLQPTCG